MHGYDNDEPDMHPFMIPIGPDIKQLTGKRHYFQIDLYPYICALLGLDKPNAIDGQIRRTLEFLKTPPNEQFIQKFEQYANVTIKPTQPKKLN